MQQTLQKTFGDRLKENEPLAKHLVFRVGGPARWFVVVKSIEELKAAIDACHEHGIHWEVLGGGSNAIASDKGFDGLVMKIGMNEVKIDGTSVTVEAGMPSVAFARKVAEAGLSGLEWMVSLPGTVGGAIRGNAGCFGGEVKDTIKQVTVLREGEIIDIDVADLQFGYRHSFFKEQENQDIILKAVFELKKDDPMIIKERMHLVLDKRKATQPLASGTAGCTFKNYEIHDEGEEKRIEDETDVPEEMVKTGRISSGWLIDQENLKGTKIGGAQVSDEHANFIINDGTATADDILQLISLMKTKVRDNYGIQLEEEIQYIGF